MFVTAFLKPLEVTFNWTSSTRIYHQPSPFKYSFQHGKRNWTWPESRLLDIKFDWALLSIKSSTRFKWAITFYARCFRERPSEEIDSYSREKDCSLRIGKKIIIVFTIIMTMILVTVKKNTSHNIDMNNDNL